MNTPSNHAITVAVPASAAGERIDKFLSRLFPEHSRSLVQQCIREERILLSPHQPVKKDHRLRKGETILISWPPPEQTEAPEPAPVDFQILYEDHDILVLNKPAGLTVHPARNESGITLVHGLLHHDRSAFASMTTDELRPGIVHRLDKDTSGIMLTAKNRQAEQKLKAAFKERKVEKVYLALVYGEVENPSGCIETRFGRHPRDRKKMSVLEKDGKIARTHYKTLCRNRHAALLEVRIETGRTHQIRVHCAYINHPILGDRVYGGKQKSLETTPKRQMLHAHRLTFPHPGTDGLKEYEAPLPEDFRRCLQELGLQPSGGD